MVRPWCARWRWGAGWDAKSIKFRYPCAPSTVELTGVRHPGQIDRVNRIDQSQSRNTITKYRIGPALAVTLGTAEIEFSGARRHAVQIDRMRQKAGADLNLTELNIVGERPVGNLFLSLGTQQITARRSVTGTRKEPIQEGNDRCDYDSSQYHAAPREQCSHLPFIHDLPPESLLVRQRIRVQMHVRDTIGPLSV